MAVAIGLSFPGTFARISWPFEAPAAFKRSDAAKEFKYRVKQGL